MPNPEGRHRQYARSQHKSFPYAVLGLFILAGLVGLWYANSQPSEEQQILNEVAKNNPEAYTALVPLLEQVRNENPTQYAGFFYPYSKLQPNLFAGKQRIGQTAAPVSYQNLGGKSVPVQQQPNLVSNPVQITKQYQSQSAFPGGPTFGLTIGSSGGAAYQCNPNYAPPFRCCVVNTGQYPNYPFGACVYQPQGSTVCGDC